MMVLEAVALDTAWLRPLVSSFLDRFDHLTAVGSSLALCTSETSH